MVSLGLTTQALSLFAPSPPKLPNLPTLADLQKHAEQFQEIIIPSTTNESSTPTSTRQNNVNAQKTNSVSSWYSFNWSNTPPPGYSVTDPAKLVAENDLDRGDRASRGVVRGGGRGLLKKGSRPGWYKVQEGLPDESASIVVKPKSGGSRAYARSISSVQPSIDDADEKGRGEIRRRWFNWCVVPRLPEITWD